MDIPYIIWFDVLPILVFLGGGWFLASKFKIEVKTYEIVITRVVLPCFVFFSLYQVKLSANDFLVLPAALLLTAILLVLSAVLSKGTAKGLPMERAFRAMATFPNACYLGAVLVYLVYSHPPFASQGEPSSLPEALAILSLLMTFAHLALRTAGYAMVSRTPVSFSTLLLRALETPVLYGALLAFALQALSISLRGTFIYPVLHHFTGAFVVLTAVTTGVMIERHHHFTREMRVLLPALVKLLVSPLLAAAILFVFPPMSALAKEIFLIFSAIPCAMSFSMSETPEHDAMDFFHASLMTQMTLSLVTLPLIIFLCRILFPASM